MKIGRGYDQVAVGDRFESGMTMTETHIVLGAGLFGDLNPLHINETFAAASHFQGRVAHGYLTSNVLAAQLGMIFHGTALAYVEHHVRFLAPVRAGDTLGVAWIVKARDDKPKWDGGVVTLDGTCTNQDGVVVATAEGKILVRNA
ncbi:MAG TPA: MaoC family dehydratase [Rhodocyclaceae bacterium]|nr:MaoC family dehydratase [Rhodocyclaceae bacterium]HNH35441.1 MaoC family dehydratase [Rhodocyclaceae bacterium]